MEKILDALKKQEVKVTDDLKQELQKVWDRALSEAKEEGKNDTGDLLTQEQVNKIIQDRLARERSSYEGELKELRGKMENLVDPSKVEEVKTGFEEQVESLQKQQEQTKKQYELKLAATQAGVKEPEYFEFLMDKEQLLDRLKLDEAGDIVAINSEGNVLTEDGKNLGPEKLVGELQEKKPELFGEKEEAPKKTTGATAPAPGSSDLTDNEKIRRAREMARELGYSKKKKESEE